MTSDYILHQHLIGQAGGVARLNTPILLVDEAALDRNIAKMAALADAAGVKLRPHAKTHKCVTIAKKQQAAGAIGNCCAKIGEAEALHAGGVTGLLITSPITSLPALERLALLAKAAPDMMLVVDNPLIASATDDALAKVGATLDVLIDIDPGIARTGVARPEDAVALAQHVAGLAHLNWRGVQFYCGSQQHIENYAERRSAMEGRAEVLAEHLSALRSASFEPEIISGSGTGTHHVDAELGLFTEWQVGSYIFMDRQYQACDLTGGADPIFEPSLFVEASVVSANHSALVTLDAGFKALSSDGGLPKVVQGGPQDAHFAFMGDEHGALIWPDISDTMPAGHRTRLIVPHCDPTVNLYDDLHVVDGDILTAIWPIEGRGRSR